jgi:hypothetical protein
VFPVKGVEGGWSNLFSMVNLNGSPNMVQGPHRVQFFDNSTTFMFNQWSNVHMCYFATVNDDASYQGPNSGMQRCPTSKLFPLVDGPKEGGYAGRKRYDTVHSNSNLNI